MWSVYDHWTDDPESDMERYFREDGEEEQEDDRTLDDYFFAGE